MLVLLLLGGDGSVCYVSVINNFHYWKFKKNTAAYNFPRPIQINSELMKMGT